MSALYDEFLELNADNPDWCSLDYAATLKCSTSHVRKMAARAGVQIRPATVGRKKAGALTSSKDAKADHARAQRHRDALVQYWAQRGYKIKAEVITLPFCKRSKCCPSTVRTDLINGLPRNWGRANG